MNDDDKPYADLNIFREENKNRERKLKEKKPAALSLAWNHDGSKLFAGFTDNLIHCWTIKSN
jgi:hypothetical protein